MQITAKDRAHWAFQPIQRPAIPAVSQPDWVRNPVDAFILAGLDTRGLKPNPSAPKYQLVRRAYYDLTGLPPTPAEVDAWRARGVEVIVVEAGASAEPPIRSRDLRRGMRDPGRAGR